MFIIHGNIKTMEGRDFADGYVEIADGKIVSVGDMEDCPGAEGEVLDVQGSLVMPGIIEAHCHMGITEEKKGMEGDDCNENVNPVTPWLRSIDAINPMDAAFNDALQAGITRRHDRARKRQCGRRSVCFRKNPWQMHRSYDCKGAGGHEGGFRGKPKGKLFRAGYFPFHPHGHCRHAQRRADKGGSLHEKEGKEPGRGN